MKTKFTIIILIGFLCLPAFAQKKIGTISKKNVLFARAINNKPAYIYYEDKSAEERLFYINFNNKDYGPYLYVFFTHADFAADHMANLVILPDGHFGIFHDGNIYGPYAIAYTWKFLNEKEYFYPADEEYVDDDETSFSVKMYCNGKELPDVRDIIVSDKNQARVTSKVTSKKEFYVEYKNNKYGPYDNEIISIDFLADGETLVYKAEKNQKYYIVINGKENGPYEECSNITFTKDKKHYAYSYKENNLDVLVKDGKIFGSYNGLDFFKFNEENGELCVIEFNTKEGFNLYYGASVYKDVDAGLPFYYYENLKAKKDSIMYYREGNSYRTKNAYINDKKLLDNIIEVYPSLTDIYDYAYLTTKTVQRKSPAAYEDDPFYIQGSKDYLDDSDYGYFGSIDEDDENIFHADCLVYKDKEFLLKGMLYNVYIFNKKDLLYATKNMDQSLSFYLNGNEIYKTQAYVMDDQLEGVIIGNDYAFFTITYEDNWEQKVYYKGKMYPGSVIENQLVYVDKGNVYLKKY